ncbi:hypothetical protein D3C75_158900 [compost metagenome]
MMNSGPIQDKILSHIDELDRAIAAFRERNGDTWITDTFINLMQAKSTALVALSNTRSQVTVSK